MSTKPKKINVYFFKSDNGRRPVREWLLGLPKNDRQIIGEDIKTVEYGWPIGMPVTRSFGGNLYEIRSDLENGDKARVLFTIYSNLMVLLHGFIKKTKKTPKKDLDLAKNRMRKFKKVTKK